jgi:hypothetical protein
MPLCLKDASAYLPARRNPFRPDSELLVYFQDLLDPFEVEMDEELLRAGPNVTWTELFDGAAAAAGIRGARPDLIVVAHALPDADPLTVVAAHANLAFGGDAHILAISEQGLQAPFTALRIAAAYTRSGRCRQAALVLLEQTTLPNRVPLVHETPLVDSAVILLLDGDGHLAVDGVRAIQDSAALPRTLAELADPADPRQTLLVLGPWVSPGQVALPLPPPLAPLPTHRVLPGSYCTSVWLALARHGREWAAQFDRVLLCDTDPRLGGSHVAVLSRRPASGREPAGQQEARG